MKIFFGRGGTNDLEERYRTRRGEGRVEWERKYGAVRVRNGNFKGIVGRIFGL